MGGSISKHGNFLWFAVPVVVVSGAITVWWIKKQRPRTYEQVGFVSGINVYPIKSCKPISLEQAECLNTGIKYDRTWLILDANDRPGSQRLYPKLALVTTSFEEDGYVSLNAPGMKTLKLPLNPEAYGPCRPIRVYTMSGEGAYAGDEAAKWCSTFLEGEGFKLYRMTQPRRLNTDDDWHAIAQAKDKVAFADYAPFMMATEKSLEYLNNELPTPLSMKRFRPNIVVSGVKEAHAEDHWNYLKVGKVEFRLLNNSARCKLTTIDPETGVKDSDEPLTTLRRIRLPKDRDKRYEGNSPFFGINLALEKGGTIKLGDAVLVSV